MLQNKALTAKKKKKKKKAKGFSLRARNFSFTTKPDKNLKTGAQMQDPSRPEMLNTMLGFFI